MNITSRTTDSADRPNAPVQGADWGSVFPPSRRAGGGAPLWLWLVALSVGGVVLLAVLILAWQFLAPLVPVWQAGIQAHAEWAGLALLLALGLVLAGIALGIARAGWAFGARASAWARQGSVVRLESDHPVLVEQLPKLQLAAGAQSGYYEAAKTFAATPGHAMTTYGPNLSTSVSYRHDVRSEAAQLAGADEDAPQILPAFEAGRPVLEQLKALGYALRSGDEVFVGTNGAASGAPARIDMRGCGSIAVIGQSGKGKSTTALLIILQAICMGWDVMVYDPHAWKDESLIKRLAPVSGRLAKQAVEPDEGSAMVRLVERIATRRAKGLDTADRRLLVVYDEFTNAVMNRWLDEQALGLIPSIALQFRGVGVHQLVIAHEMSAKTMGNDYGALLRRSFTHRLVHRIDRDAGDLVLPTGAAARAAQLLDVGRAIYWGDSEPIVVDVPRLSLEDSRYAAAGTPERPYRRWPVFAQAGAAPPSVSTLTPPPGASAPVPPAPCARTEPIPGMAEPTNAERIQAFLHRTPDTWQMSPEIATGTGLESKLVQAELSRMHKAGTLDRQGRNGSYRYRPARQHASTPAGAGKPTK